MRSSHRGTGRFGSGQRFCSHRRAESKYYHHSQTKQMSMPDNACLAEAVLDKHVSFERALAENPPQLSSCGVHCFHASYSALH